MTRIHGLVLSLLLAAAAVLGAYATIHTANIGAAARPRAATAAELRARSVRLDKWSKTLDKALRTKPPALPAIPHYGRLTLPMGPAVSTLAGVTRERSRTPAAAVSTARVDASVHERVAPAGRSAPAPQANPTPPADTGPAAVPEAPTPTAPPPTPQPPAPPSAPTGEPAAPASGSTPSVEQQCEALEQAAEGKGEAAKQAAERQCEALKHPGGGGGTTGGGGSTGGGTTGGGGEHEDDD